jgi:hypothetical protein
MKTLWILTTLMAFALGPPASMDGNPYRCWKFKKHGEFCN